MPAIAIRRILFDQPEERSFGFASLGRFGIVFAAQGVAHRLQV